MFACRRRHHISNYDVQPLGPARALGGDAFGESRVQLMD